MSYRELLSPYAGGAALDRLASYAALLERWSAVHSLVRFRSPEELVRRHLGQCLADGGPASETGRLLDVGSGAGLPGIPRLCVAPRWTGLLLEPRQKRWAFLRHVVRELGLEASVERWRYQELDPSHDRFDSITSRAVGNHRALLAWSADRLAPGGGVSLWLGEEDLESLRELAGWRVVSSAPLGRDGGRLARFEPCFT